MVLIIKATPSSITSPRNNFMMGFVEALDIAVLVNFLLEKVGVRKVVLSRVDKCLMGSNHKIQLLYSQHANIC